MISNQTITNLCRDCNGSFQVEVSYNELGAATSFIPKYCPECNKKPKITGNNGSWGTVNIESAKVPQRNVEGLEESLQTLATSIVNDRGEFRAFKKHAEYDIEQNIKMIKKNKDNILNNKIRLDFFHAKQSVFNKEQTKFNDTVLKQIKEIHKTLIIGFSVLVFFMLVTWSYLLYTLTIS